MLFASDFIELLPVFALEALKGDFLCARDCEQAVQPQEEKCVFIMLRIIP